MNRRILKILLVSMLAVMACGVIMIVARGVISELLISKFNQRYQTTSHAEATRQVSFIYTLAAGTETAETATAAFLATDTPDPIATQVAIARAVAQTLTAEAPIPLTEQILFSMGDNLYRMGLDGSSQEIIAHGLWRSERLALDAKNQKLYISYWDQTAQIRVFDLSTGYHQPFRDGPTDGGQGIAIDAAAGILVLGLYYNGVYIAEPHLISPWAQIVNPNVFQPLLGQRGQLQIDPTNRQIYFRTAFNGDCGLCRSIWRVDYDGGNLTAIIPANGGDGLALDLQEKVIYFSDVPGNYTIKRARLDGSSDRVILTLPEPYRFCRSIALDARRKMLYFSLFTDDYKGRAIARANVDGTGFEILYQASLPTEEDSAGDMILYLP